MRGLHRCGITIGGASSLSLRDFNQPAGAGNEARTRFPASLEPPPAIRGNPALPRIQNALRAWVEVESSLFLTKNRTSKSDVLFHSGAGNEARTRYLHLGKVALYQMSYARGTRCILTNKSHLVKHFPQFSSLSFSEVSAAPSSKASSSWSASSPSGSSGWAAANAASSSSVGSSRNSTRPTGPSAG